MPDSQHIGEMKADIRNICNTLDRMGQYMSKQIDQHATTNARLAVIERVQNDMKEGTTAYQQECEKDRKDFGNRIEEVEGFQSRQIKIAGLVAAFIGFVTSFGVEWFKK